MTQPGGAASATAEMDAIFSRGSHLRHMLAFEAALAHAEGRAGVIPAEAATAIEQAAQPGAFDVGAFLEENPGPGVPVVPLVRRLTAGVAAEAQGYVHWATTTQDVEDTATVLQMRAGLGLIVDQLLAIAAACASLAERHRGTPMPGRTFLQHATPITFGLKAARWLAMVVRQARAIGRVRDEALALQLGGASGTLAPLGDRGLAVADLLGERLGLPVPDLPWHAERDRIAAITTAVGVAAGAMAKIAGDVVLLAQTEVGELAEGAGPDKGGSSTMPQKRNPADSVAATAAARLALAVVPVVLAAMAHEHERAVGGWQTEWVAIPDLFGHTARALARVRAVVEGLEVDAARMRANLDAGGGLIMAEALTFALAARIGRHRAYPIVRDLADRVSRDGITLRQAAHDDERARAALSAEAIDRALDPAAYLGSADAFVERALNAYRELLSA